MKKFLLSILGMLLLSTQIAVAQNGYREGYVVMASNDTLHGLIDYRSWDITPTVIKFKTAENAEVKKFNAYDLNSFFVADEYYISREVDIDRSPRTLSNIKPGNTMDISKERLFLQVYFRGAANLYSHYDKSQNNHFFIETENVPLQELLYQFTRSVVDGKSVLVKKTRYKGQLLYFMRDCEDIKADINRLSYTKKAFVNVFKKYNACTGREVIYKHEIEQAKIEKIALLGVSYTNISFPSSSLVQDASFDGSAKPTLGLGVNINIARQRLSVYNDLMLRSYTTTAFREESRGVNSLQDYNFNIRFTYLKLSSMLRYYWRTPKVNIFIGGGMSNGFALRSIQEYETTRYWIPDTETKEIYEEGAKKYELGYAGSVGLSVNKLNFELRYESGNGFRKNALEKRFRVSTETLMFLFGYRI